MRTSRLLACAFLTLIRGTADAQPTSPQDVHGRGAVGAGWAMGPSESVGRAELGGGTPPTAISHLIANAASTNALHVGDVLPTSGSSVFRAFGQPHLIDGGIGDVIVRIVGSVCTGTPITGTVYVVTAAHCVLTPRGNVIQRTVVRDGISYRPVAVLVDTDYADQRREQVDAAVLVMGQAIPGPSARVGLALPESGQVTLAGYQPIDRGGTLLRDREPNDAPPPTGASETEAHRSHPAGCVVSVRYLEVTAGRVMVPCGLVGGASGGGLFTENNGEFLLVGILSTVTADQSANGIVPVSSLGMLLRHRDEYSHQFSIGEACAAQCRGTVPCEAWHSALKPGQYVGISVPDQGPCIFSGLLASSRTPHDTVLESVEVGRQRP